MTNAAGTRRKKAVIAPKKKDLVACHEIGHALVVGTVKAAHQKALNILRERAHRKRGGKQSPYARRRQRFSGHFYASGRFFDRFLVT